MKMRCFALFSDQTHFILLCKTPSGEKCSLIQGNQILSIEKKNPLVGFFCSPFPPTLSSQVPHLFVPLAPAPGVPDGADDPRPSQRVVPQQPRPVGQVMAIRVGAGVRVGHGGDDGGLHHPL